MINHHHALTGIEGTVKKLKHFLPAQASLKDFIHHNTLHSFQSEKFFDGIRQASTTLGYKVSLSLEEYRRMYRLGRISDQAIQKVLEEYIPGQSAEIRQQMIAGEFSADLPPRIGKLRAYWKKLYHIDLDSLVHPVLFRIICSYLDQGISIWNFPLGQLSFLAAIRELERISKISFFRTHQAKRILLDNKIGIEELLKRVVGDEDLFEYYLFDQQFMHPGWSGIVSVIEDMPETLLDQRHISLSELLQLELLLELDALWFVLGNKWKPIGQVMPITPPPLFEPVEQTELHRIIEYWQRAFERSYHDQVLRGITELRPDPRYEGDHSMQGLFCIDDRECSFRRYVEEIDPRSQTFGTPGFFGVEFYYQPQDGKFLTKLCPAPVHPKYLIRELHSLRDVSSEMHFRKNTHGLFRAWLITQTLGFWTAVKLFLNIFRPTMSPATASSFRHMDKRAALSIDSSNPPETYKGLQVGFTKEEMVTRLNALLKSIGLIRDFAPIVYVIGHGSSSVNNPHYAAYDCGACSGRAGSVNARVICHMANDPVVREMLLVHGIEIPPTTRFVGGLHDTTRDEIVFFDEALLSESHQARHRANERVFQRALDLNAKERSRRFESIDTRETARKIHDQILIRSVSLFEPRPELNHATNALCIVGRRSMTDGLFLDRRSFMNSYDYQIDPEGNFLFNILKAAAPVCGGINLEYYFSRVDNQKLGAGTKLPHNVMGLFGVANGIDGDLRPGLPSQMIEVHDPVRLMIIVEHFPEIILKTIQRSGETYEWFLNEWVLLISVHPENRSLMKFRDGAFYQYEPAYGSIPATSDPGSIIGSTGDNIPVHVILKN